MAMSIEACCNKQLAALEKLTERVERTNHLLAEIAKALGVGTAQKIQLQFEGSLPGMPGTETDIQTIPCTALETDADDQPVTLNPANVQWSIDDATVAQLTQNADGSATFKALKVGTANISCTDTVANVTGTDTLTVTAGPANKLSLVFGAATP